MRRRHTLVAVGCSALLAVTVPSGVAVADSYWGGMGAAAPPLSAGTSIWW